MQTDVTAQVPPAERDDAAPPKKGLGVTRWTILSLLALGWVAGVFWRLWLGHRVGYPIGHADEDSYLNAARAIAGGPGGFSSETPLFRRIGYPMFISPAFALGLDFSDAYRVVQVLNAIANAATLPLAYLLGRRMFRLDQWRALAAAFAAATLPAAIFWSIVAMTDSVLAPMLLGWLLAVHWWLRAPDRKRAAIVAGIMTGLLYTIHVRGTILTGIYFGLLLLLLVRRRAGWRAVSLSAVPVVVLAVLNQVVILLLGDKVELRGDIVGAGTIEVLTSSNRLQVFFASIGTNLWYLCVVSFGLAGIGWAVGGLEIWRRKRDVPYRWTTGLALVSTAGVTVGSALVMAGLVNTNADAIYTRYVQMFVPFWLLFGFATLLGSDLRTALRAAVLPVLVFLAGGALLVYRLHYVAAHGHHLSYGAFGGPDLISITAGWSGFRPLVGSAIGLFGCAVLVAGTRFRRLAGPLAAAIVVANVATMVVMREHIVNPLGDKVDLAVHLRDLGVGPKDKVAITTLINAPMYYSLYHEVTWMAIESHEVPPPDVNVMLTRWLPNSKKDWHGTQFGFRRIGGSTTQHWAVWRRQ
jgi:4-amino-4-deoxy-L-arabinose transferase-like glycosyltransferase